MSTRRERELRLTSDQAAYVGKALDASVRRVVKIYSQPYRFTYDGCERDRAIIKQVLEGIVYELHRDLEDTLARVTRRFIP